MRTFLFASVSTSDNTSTTRQDRNALAPDADATSNSVFLLSCQHRTEKVFSFGAGEVVAAHGFASQKEFVVIAEIEDPVALPTSYLMEDADFLEGLYHSIGGGFGEGQPIG